MYKKLLTMTIGVVALVVVLIPAATKAENSVVLTNSDGLTDITESAMTDKDEEDHGDSEEHFFILCDGSGFEDCVDIEDGTEYELEFTVTGDDAEDGPVLIFVMGADVDYENSWSYDAETGILTVPFTKETFYDEDGSLIPAFGVSIMFAVAEGQDGPPIQMQGSFLASTVMNNQMIPPSPGNPYFGFSATGAEGTTGFIHFLIPVDLIELLSYYEYRDYTSLSAEDMAVFDNDSQVSGNVTELVDGSALVEVDVEFTQDMTAEATMARASNTVTKTITAKEKLPISLSLRKTSIKKGKKVNAYGWTKKGEKGDKVRIYRKKKGNKKYTKIKTVTTKNNGRYIFKDKRNKKGTFFYKVKYKNDRNKLKVSDKIKLIVRK